MIQAQNLGHFYGEHRALVDVSFEIERGTIVGLVGPNGAGKSTTMKIVTGYMAPTYGTVRIAGVDVVENRLEAQARLGYLPESAPLYRDMTVREYLEYMARLRGVAAGDLASRLAYAIGACSLESVARRPIGELSKGYRQRVGLAQAMVHDPDLLVLDEPTSGLDPNQILEIRDLVRALERSLIGAVDAHRHDARLRLDEGPAVFLVEQRRVRDDVRAEDARLVRKFEHLAKPRVKERLPEPLRIKDDLPPRRLPRDRREQIERHVSVAAARRLPRTKRTREIAAIGRFDAQAERERARVSVAEESREEIRVGLHASTVFERGSESSAHSGNRCT
jgi:ABC-2 type transport system ATP-binding protein